MNPELRRNVWLQFTPERLIAMPAIVALAATVVVATVGWRYVGNLAWLAAAALGLLWGPRLAGASVASEIADRTWDFQRASSLGGWQMAWAKLVGGTAYAWYGIGVMLLAWAVAGEPDPSARDWAHLLFACILGQAVALFSALLLAERQRGADRIGGISHIFGVIVGVFAYRLAVRLAKGGPHGPASWFGLPLDGTALEILSLTFLSGWAIIGAWRLMAGALQIPVRPWAWPAFLASVAAWLAGFASAPTLPGYMERLASITPALAALAWAPRLTTAFLAVLGLTWLAAFADPKSPVGLQRCGAAWREGRVGAALALAPSWIRGLPVLLALAIGVAIAPTAVGVHGDGLSLFVAVLLLFLARDITLMHAIVFHRKGRRGVPLVVYFAVLYGLLPILARILGAGVLLPALLPPLLPGALTPWALGLLVLQLAAAGGLAWHALRGPRDRAAVASRRDAHAGPDPADDVVVSPAAATAAIGPNDDDDTIRFRYRCYPFMLSLAILVLTVVGAVWAGLDVAINDTMITVRRLFFLNDALNALPALLRGGLIVAVAIPLGYYAWRIRELPFKRQFVALNTAGLTVSYLNGGCPIAWHRLRHVKRERGSLRLTIDGLPDPWFGLRNAILRLGLGGKLPEVEAAIRRFRPGAFPSDSRPDPGQTA